MGPIFSNSVIKWSNSIRVYSDLPAIKRCKEACSSGSTSFSAFISHLHKLSYFLIHIIRVQHPQMMIELNIAWYLRYFLEAKIIIKSLLKRKYNVNKVFP